MDFLFIQFREIFEKETPLDLAATRKITRNSSIALLFKFVGQLIPLRFLELFTKISAIYFTFINFLFKIFIDAPIFFKIFIKPILVGFTFIFLINNLDFSDKIVSTIKKAHELRSPGIL